ncbi:TetR/AcrR family transcriptional regulator [Sphingomonadaceae bacterium jetA1]|uniref:TetR/AcrR family transcriptional regulator n=1 Tax=Facivitalis istanbulensis TaxID=3075838 RepID=UPI00347C397B
MNETAEAIMDAAERRIRAGGYGGFSFRDLAADVGVKSASVHYHFPTKDMLVAAVARRYNDRVVAAVEQEIATGADAVEAWRKVFRDALAKGAHMCLCGSLGATAGDLAPDVATEVRRFFDLGVDSLMAGGLPRARAMQALALLEGAILMASVQGDSAIFDAATAVLADPAMRPGAAIAPS